MKAFVWILVVVLLIIHQDNWFWDDGTLVFGFMPMGMFYQVCISLAAAGVWFLATRFAWPTDLEVNEAPAAERKGGGG